MHKNLLTTIFRLKCNLTFLKKIQAKLMQNQTSDTYLIINISLLES